MNKEYIINDSVTTLAIAIANHRQLPNESYVSACVDKVNQVFKPQWIKHHDDILCLFEVCHEINPEDINLIAKCSKLLIKVLPKLNSSNENILKNTICWILSCILFSTNHELNLEQINKILNFYICTIQTYGNLNINNSIIISEVMGSLQPLLQQIQNKFDDPQINTRILTYIKFLDATVVVLKDYECISTVGINMITFMEKSIHQNNNNMQLYEQEVLKYTLQILLQLIDNSKLWTNENFNKLLPIILVYLRYGLIFNPHKFLNDLQPSPIVQWEHLSKLDLAPTINMTYKHRQKKKIITESKNKVPKLVTFSVDDEVLINIRDTDFSEDEPCCASNVKEKIILNIRLLAAQIMKKMFTIVEKKILLGYLYSIIDGPMSIQNCLIPDVENSVREPSSKVRATIITVITTIFNGSKIYFSQAQYREKKGAFTTWSETLANYIITVHNTLLKDFSMETLSVRLVLLHCFSTMIINTSYTRLNKNLLKSVLDTILVYTKCEPCENYLRIGVFRCLSSVFNSKLPDFEKEFLIEKRTEIVNLCLYLFKETKLFLDSDQDNTQIIVRRQCWQILNGYCNHYHGLIENRMLINIAIEDMKYTKQTLLRKNILLCLKQMSAVSEENYKSAKLEKWKLIFRKLIPQLFKEKDPQILPILIESLSTIGSDIFNELEEELINSYCDELHTFVTCTDQNIQSSAIATLGTLIKYEKMSNNPIYIKHTIDCLLYVSSINKVNLIQEKFAYALNCLSEILVENWNLYEVEEVKLLCLVKAALSTLDRKPCRACGTRALGLLLSLIDHTDVTEQQFVPLFCEVIETLINIANGKDSMKNRWNSCNSLGVLYQTKSIQMLPEAVKNNVFNTLSTLIINCSNFKVRQVACSSLTFNRRELYGNNYMKMWHRLLDAFENAQNLPHICEHKHQQKLINQLCVSFCNLCRLLEPVDISNLIYLFDSRIHVIQIEMKKFCNLIDIPNYSEILASTHKHLHNLLKTKQLTSKQLEIVNNLLNIFYDR